MKQGFFGKPILKKTLAAWLIGFVILSSATYGTEGNIVNPPLSVGKPLLVTPSIYRLTDRYVVTKDADGLSFLDVQTGEPTQAEDFEDDTPSQTYLQLPDGDLPVKRFTFTQNWNGDEFISTDNSQVLRLNDGLFFRFLKNGNDKALLSVWDANSKNMLGKEVAVPTNESLSRVEAIDELLLVNVGNICYFYNPWTGQLKLSIQNVGFFRSQRWANFLLVGKTLIDIDKMTVVREFETDSLRMDLGRVYVYSHPEKEEPGWYSFVDLETLEETFFKLDMSQVSYTQGVCNGLFMCWNDKERSAQIIDPLTAEVYFSHQISQIHSQRWGFYENDRHILFFDSAQMSCFDSMSKEILWEKEFVTRTEDLRNGFFWEPTIDESLIKVFKVSDKDKITKIIIDPNIEKEYNPMPNIKKEYNSMPNIYASDECVLTVNIKDQINYDGCIRRYEWGSQGECEKLKKVPSGRDSLMLMFVYNNIVCAWTEKNETGELYKCTNGDWGRSFESDVFKGSSKCGFYDRFLAFYSDETHVKVLNLNLGTNIAKSIEVEKGSEFRFVGGFFVISLNENYKVFEPTAWGVLDESTGIIADLDGDTLYMVKGKVFKIFIKGKLITKTLDLSKTLDPSENHNWKYSVSNGLLLVDNLLFDSDGTFCQELPTSMFGTTIVTVNGKTCLRQDSGSQVFIHELVESARYSISRVSGIIVVKNIGKKVLKGRCWVEPSIGMVCTKLKEPIALDVVPDESFMINVGESQSTVFFKTNGFLDSNNSDKNKKPAWLGSISLQDGEILNIIETD